ncbi:MAG: CDIF630_02480 family spore surface protein [Acetivibrionales bacterium]
MRGGVFLTDSYYKKKAAPIERHDTAAWANIESTKQISKVTMPSEEQVDNAKQHADSNQK